MKFGHVFFLDMRQTDKQTDTLTAILRTTGVKITAVTQVLAHVAIQ